MLDERPKLRPEPFECACEDSPSDQAAQRVLQVAQREADFNGED
jgi:hypothetical protein